MHLKDALILFKRLGVDVRSLSAREFSLAYLQLARRYHPDRGNQKSHELMANINWLISRRCGFRPAGRTPATYALCIW